MIFLILSLTFLVEIILFTFIIRYNINIFSVYLINFAIFINSVLCIYLLFYVNQKNQAQMNAELLEQKLISEEAHIRGTRQLYNELSKMRHDYKGHLTCTLGLLHDRQYETAVHYIENLIDQKLDAYTGIFHSDFDILNTLLNVQANICRSAGIKYSASILCSSTGSISDIDLSILLSNLFDNSVRACKECESPSIDIEFRNIKSYFVISIKNTIKESVLKNNHDLTTTKNDKALHGFGKQVISDIATKYSGIYNYYEEDLFFITEIWLL